MALINKETKYKAPEWSKIPEHKFKLNVLKNGQNLETIPLHEKPFYILGRSKNDSDIYLTHPSLSRQHCVIQHKSGHLVYLFDLSSSNKTFLNKKPLKPFEYTKMSVGDFFQLGSSTRYYFLDGPNDLMPSETNDGLDYALQLTQKTQKTKKTNNFF